MQLPKFLRRSPAKFDGPTQLHQEPYRGRGVSHPNSFVPPSQYTRDNSPPPDPALTQADFDDAAKHVLSAGERQLAFAMQVNDYCREIARDMQVKGAAVAEEMRRSLAMSQRVAQGAQAMTKFLYDEGLPSEREELAEALAPVAGESPPPAPPSEPTSSSGEKEGPEGPSRREEMPPVQGRTNIP